VNSALVIPLKGEGARVRAKISPVLGRVDQAQGAGLLLGEEPQVVLDVHLGLAPLCLPGQSGAVAPVVPHNMTVATLTARRNGDVNRGRHCLKERNVGSTCVRKNVLMIDSPHSTRTRERESSIFV